MTTNISVRGYDSDNFNPEQIKITYPPAGEYCLAIMGVEESIVKNSYRMVNVHYEIASGEHRKKTFKIGYYIGNPNVEQAQWAFEALGRLYYAITGKRPTREKGIVFAEMLFKPFMAFFDVTEKGDKSYPKLSSLKNIPSQERPATESPSWSQ